MIRGRSTGRLGSLAGALGLLIAVSAPAQQPVAVQSFPAEAVAITVDVLVLDKDGRPVRDLTKDDFSVLEDGRMQTIVGFEARDLLTAKIEPAATPGPVATNQGASSRPGRMLAFALDDLGLDPIRSGADAQKAIARWLEEKADPRDEVTIATTSGDVWWSDTVGHGKADLLAVLKQARGKKLPNETREYISDWEASEIVSGAGLGGVSSHTGAISSSRGTDEGSPSNPGPPEQGQTELGGVLGRVVKRWSASACAGMSAEMCAMLVNRRSQEVHARTLRRRSALVRLVDRFSQALADRRGRKSIVLFSEGFIELPQVAPDEKALDAARRANVAVYFVDARGLVAQSFYNAENAAAPQNDDAALMTLDLDTLSVAGGKELAQATGGFAVQSNDLLDGLARAADESSAYYLLGYQPEQEPDGKWHSLKVAVNRPGVKVRARRGYVATPPPRPAAVPTNASAPSQSSSALIDPVLVAGGDRDAVPLRLVCRPVGSGKDGTRVLVGLDIGTSGLSFTDSGKGGAAALDITLLSVHRDRPLPDSFEQRVTLRGDSAAGADWWVFTHELVVAPGPVQVKALVRDIASGRTGTVTQRIDVPAQLADPPHDFELHVGAFHFEPRDGKRNTTILVQVPAIPDASAEHADERTRFALVARIEDAAGQTTERLTHEWSSAGLSSGLLFRGAVALTPGDYALDSSVLDLVTGALSIDRRDLHIPAASGLALSSVAILGSGATVEDRTQSTPDPFQVGSVAFEPRVDARVGQGTKELPLFFRVYPSGDSPIELTLEIHREGTQLVALHPALPPPETDGGRVWLGSVPLATLPPGRYEIVVRAVQGTAKAEERLAFEVTASAHADKPTDKGVASRSTKSQTNETALAQALRKAGQYVTEYAQAFRNLVAEEVYEQTEERPQGMPLRRRTRADIAFVALGGPFVWGSFRDVFEADGHAVRDRQSRLEKLFVQKAAAALDQARAIRTESARYNIGVARTVNEPTLPLMFLHPANQQRFRFRAEGHKSVSGIESLEISFEEVARPTMIRNDQGKDLPANGRFWIDPDRGTMLKSEMVFDLSYEAASVMGRSSLERIPKAWITVEYRPEASLSIWVPSEMKERYPYTRATAWYSGYRRFSVGTTESFQVQK